MQDLHCICIVDPPVLVTRTKVFLLDPQADSKLRSCLL
jgi:hypothetical protein